MQEDHIAQMLSVRKPSQDFSKRNYTRLLKLQSELKQQKAAKSLPAHPPFKLSRFRSIGAMVFKEEERQPVRTLSVQPSLPSIKPVLPAMQEITTAVETPIQVVIVERESPLSPTVAPATSHLSAETIRKKREEEETMCPAGIRLLSKEEQAAAYAKLLEEQKQTIIAINKVPLASTTPSIVKRRIDLERRLADLEKSLAVFQRTKVYVQT